MKTKKYILLLSLGLALASCHNEDPFESSISGGEEGQFYTAALNLSVTVDETIKVRSREGNEDLLPDFDVYFLNSSGQAVKTYKYGEMPEIVSLTQGNYKIVASYGQDVAAAWNNPHFKGVSKEFAIKANQITTDIDPVECTLQNVMVSVVYDSELLQHIEGNPTVEVYVNKTSSLIFNKSHSDNKTPGYFKHDEVSTLTAEFTGVVDGVELTEVKTLNNIQPGNHYRLTFYRHVYVGDESGFIEGGVKVDAKVSVNNLSGDVVVEDESVLTDVTWPSEDNGNTENPGDNEGDDPEDPDDPANPGEPSTAAPTITLDPSSTVAIGKVNNVSADDVVIMLIHSEKGLTKFTVDIVSENLHLSDLGADSDSLDLVNPGNMLETLQYLGLLKEGQESLRGETDVDFDITGFMEMLTAVKGEHHFIVTVGDENGETSETLILNVL